MIVGAFSVPVATIRSEDHSVSTAELQAISPVYASRLEWTNTSSPTRALSQSIIDSACVDAVTFCERPDIVVMHPIHH